MVKSRRLDKDKENEARELWTVDRALKAQIACFRQRWQLLLRSFAGVEFIMRESKSRIPNGNLAVSKSKKEQLTETLLW